MTKIEYKVKPDPSLKTNRLATIRPSDAVELRNIVLGILLSYSENSGGANKALENVYKNHIKDRYGWIDAKSSSVEEIFNELVDWLRREFGQPQPANNNTKSDAKLRRIEAIIDEE